MNDTPPEIEARLRTLFGQRSGSERAQMAFEMFDFARMLIVASIKADEPDICDVELRVRIFERTYGDDFDAAARARIIARIRS